MMNKKLLIVSIIVISLVGYKWAQNHNTSQAKETDQPPTTNSLSIQDSTKEVKQLPSKKTKNESGEGITVIGDSVVVGVAPVLEEQLPGIIVDGKVSRQMKQAHEVVDELKAKGQLGDRIVFELGTNGPFKEDVLRSLLDSLSDKKVYLVNTRVPREWQDSVNETLSEVANEYSNTIVIDWYSASEGKKEYFYKDGVHLNPEGSKYYASIIMDAINNLKE